MNKLNRYFTLAIVIFILIAWGIFLYLVGPETIIQTLGVRNSYLAAFLIALIGGTSVFTTASFYATLAALAIGGLNIFILSFISAVGVALGDSFFFFLGSRGRNLSSPSFKNKLDKFSKWLYRLPGWLTPFFVFIYTGLIPLPNDILMVSLGLGKYKFKKIIPFVFLGDFVFMFLISFLSREGIKLIF